MSDREKIIRWFYRKVFPVGILQFDDLLAEAAESALGKKDVERDKYILANKIQYWNVLINNITIDTKRGLSPLFMVVDTFSRRMVWYPYCGEILDKKKKLRLGLCSSRPAFLKRFDIFNWREYEALGCAIAKLAGASNITLTPPGTDCGIDFFARIVLPGNTHVFSGEGSAIRVVGQSKKYAVSLDLGRFGRFLNTLNELRNLEPNVKKIMPPWFFEASGPIVGWMVAHSGFQSGVETKAKHNGIILSTSLDLAEIAAKSRKLAYFQSDTARVEKLHVGVKDILTEHGG